MEPTSGGTPSGKGVKKPGLTQKAPKRPLFKKNKEGAHKFSRGQT